jgi:hypothetical protein
MLYLKPQKYTNSETAYLLKTAALPSFNRSLRRTAEVGARISFFDSLSRPGPGSRSVRAVRSARWKIRVCFVVVIFRLFRILLCGIIYAPIKHRLP